MAEVEGRSPCPDLQMALAAIEVVAAQHPSCTIPHLPGVTSGLAPAELLAHGWYHRRGHRPVTEYRTLLRAAARLEHAQPSPGLADLS